MAVLTNILKGDKFAARWLLLSIISRVHSRDKGMVIGNMPINISNVTREQAEILRDFLFHLPPVQCIRHDN